MLTLNSKHRAWVIVAVAVWLAVLAAIIFIPQSRAGGEGQATYTNSLQRSLRESTPADSDAVVAQLVDPARVYDPALYVGYVTLCPTEPEPLAADKIAQLGIDESAVDLEGRYGYVVLLPTDGSAPGLDEVDLNAVDICTIPMDTSYPLNAPLPFYTSAGSWVLGTAAS
ncbi:hypothetical protein [Corynebacterium timonense]|uniref:Uncharacterized protein n=1 Tax=Corynebacterium timonense TaxID=441500 RepID=A0A1H1SHQ6_9CORY|nr:hypothetical protein [Corynebacterium timonense]SDS47507.1 hypothetical protein SAMN04488539_1747 [Corynebacterium timonense]